MHFILTTLIVCFFIFLFTLYYLAKDDFIIARKDISLEKIFNAAILSMISSLLFARYIYIFLSGNKALLNPLKFFDIPYYPGLSLIGGLIGWAIFTLLYAKYKNMPVGKIFDLFAMSFITILPLGFFLLFIFSLFNTLAFFNILFVTSTIIFFVFAKIIFPFSQKGEIEDGSLGLIFLAIFSFTYFTAKLLLDIKGFSLVSGENLMLFLLLFSSIIVLINREIVDKFLNKK